MGYIILHTVSIYVITSLHKRWIESEEEEMGNADKYFILLFLRKGVARVA